jgi:thymidylate synthase (FAD)
MNEKIYTLQDNIGFVQLIQSVGDDTTIVNSARVSFGKRINKIEDQDVKLIKYLLEHEHGTPFEHNSLTFLIKAPLFVVQQHLRHRISSFNQISGRYVEIKEEFYIPKNFRKQSISNRQASIETDDLDNKNISDIYREGLKLSYSIYQNLLKAGVCREQARGVLPHCTYSEYYWTCNLRSLLHFLKLRDNEYAQWEIRQYAKAFKLLAKDLFPVTFKILKEIKKCH